MRNMFASGEDGVAVQKEIMQILQQQGNDSLFADKGLDAGISAVFIAVQVWLKSRGIDFLKINFQEWVTMLPVCHHG